MSCIVGSRPEPFPFLGIRDPSTPVVMRDSLACGGRQPRRADGPDPPAEPLRTHQRRRPARSWVNSVTGWPKVIVRTGCQLWPWTGSWDLPRGTSGTRSWALTGPGGRKADRLLGFFGSGAGREDVPTTVANESQEPVLERRTRRTLSGNRHACGRSSVWRQLGSGRRGGRIRRRRNGAHARQRRVPWISRAAKAVIASPLDGRAPYGRLQLAGGRPLLTYDLLPSSVPRLVRGTFAEVFTLWALIADAAGSGLRPSFTRTRPARPWVSQRYSLVAPGRRVGVHGAMTGEVVREAGLHRVKAREPEGISGGFRLPPFRPATTQDHYREFS